jgi:hypothetical protein
VADDVGSPAATGSWPAPGRQQEGYPTEWPRVALIVKAAAGWRCEHCGVHLPPGGAGDEALTVHHLEGPLTNLMDWNLVPLCLRDHGLVEREVRFDVEQLVLEGCADPWPWLPARQRERQAMPFRPTTPSTSFPPSTGDGQAVGDALPDASSLQRGGAGGEVIPGRRGGRQRLYRDQAGRQRAYRDRKAPQQSLLTLLPAGDRGDT